jgi:diaminopimelate decarboxylase
VEVAGGELKVGGIAAPKLAARFGTPLLVLCEETIRARARAYREAAPDALVVYGMKAFPNVAVMRVLAEEGLGADVSTLGELAFAGRAGVPPERLVVHGNNRSVEELRAAAEAGAGLVVLDALDDVAAAAAAGVRRVLVRLTPGVGAKTHEAIRTGHSGSKFGLPPDPARKAVAAARAAGLDAAGVHVHVGSQLLDAGAFRETAGLLAEFAADCRDELGWTPSVVDLGGGLGVAHVEDERPPSIPDFVGALLGAFHEAWSERRLPPADLVLEPGRSLVGPAGVTLYRVGVVKRAGDGTTYVAVDGGMSDNPRPQLYGARYAALVAGRADEAPDGRYAVCGKHCESGDVLIGDVPLAAPAAGDVLAVPATGAYTLAMASNYNVVPRPAAVLVRAGEARLIRERETVADLLSLERG